MVDQESGVPGGWGAQKSTNGGGTIKEPIKPVVYGASQEGTYTDVQGRPITKEQYQAAGGTDKPGEIGQKLQAQSITASKIEQMLKSPSTQFASQEAAQKAYDIATRSKRISPEEVKAQVVTGTVAERKAYEAATVEGKAAQEVLKATGETRLAVAQPATGERFKQYSVVEGLPLAKTTYEYPIGQTPETSKYNIFGFPIGKMPVEAGVTYIKPALFGKTQVTRERIETRKVTQQELNVLQIGAQGVALTTPFLPSKFVAFKDVWAKIPTQRQSALARGEILTRKIEIGKTFTEPKGVSTEITVGKQKQLLMLEKPLQTEKGIKQTPYVGYVSEYALQQARTLDETMIALAKSQRQTQKTLLPSYEQIKLSRTPGIYPLNISKQEEKGKIGIVPIFKLTTIPEVKTSLSPGLKPATVQKAQDRTITTPIIKPVQMPLTKVTPVQMPEVKTIALQIAIPKMETPTRLIERVTPKERPTETRQPEKPIIPKTPVITYKPPDINIFGGRKAEKTQIKRVVETPYTSLESVFNIRGSQRKITGKKNKKSVWNISGK